MVDSLRTAARTAVERLLLSSGAAARSRRRGVGRVAILAYHNVVPAGTANPGEVSLHLGADEFRRQLDRLVQTHQVVSLSEAVGAERNRDPAALERPLAVITFDDGYRGVLRHAVPELVDRKLPATVFVCPGLLGAEGFWWDRVALAPGGPEAGWRSRALGKLGGRQAEVLASMNAGSPPEVCRPVAADEIRQLADAPGITLASHTWSHPNLTSLGDDELRGELTRPSHWLAEHVSKAHLSGHVSVPYGLWDERVKQVAEEAGHRFLYRVEGGLSGPAPGPGVLPRINIPAGVSVRGFELRASGLRG